MSNPLEHLLQKMIGDPSLMKKIALLVASKSKESKSKALKEAGNPAHVNCLTIHCKLCGSIEKAFIRMDWDKADKIFRSGCYHMDNVWTHLPTFQLIQRKPTCKICFKELSKLEKDDLIKRLITIAERKQ